MAQRRWLGLAVQFLLLAGSLAAGWWLVTSWQGVADWWQLRNYTPSVAVVQLADAASMVGRGRDMFYVSDPQIEGKDAFNKSCTSNASEHGSVLGCYSQRRIYIYDVNDPRLPGVKEVTAAHEMLHAAYERLDTATKNRIDSLLQAELNKRSGDAELQEVLDIYRKTEPGELLNEMHSILATEYNDLSPELNQYFSQYFTDRAKVVGLAQGYKGVFQASKARIAGFKQQLEALKNKIDANVAVLDQLKNTLDSENNRLAALRASDPDRYNQEVPGYNAKVDTYNRTARDTQSLVNQYNAIVTKIDAEIAQQTELNNSLDSKHQPLPTQ